jgi:hypothetical protein
MDIDVHIGRDSLTLEIENPYRIDLTRISKQITDFGIQHGAALSVLNIEKLLRGMIKGVSGCESGCPANAKSLVREGFGEFKLTYVEGGILSAVHDLENDRSLIIKVFPDFG